MVQLHLQQLYLRFRICLKSAYGFYDSINLGVNAKDAVCNSYLAIDQGPIVVMIENYRSGLIWNLFMRNRDVQRGLKILGFSY